MLDVKANKTHVLSTQIETVLENLVKMYTAMSAVCVAPINVAIQHNIFYSQNRLFLM